MRKSSNEIGRFTDEELIQQFLAEARRVQTHPETSKVSPALMTIRTQPGTLPAVVEVPLEDEQSWQHLSITVRKLILLPGESLHVKNVLATFSKNRRDAGSDVKALLTDIKRWEKTPLFYMGELGKADDPSDSEDPVLISVRVAKKDEDVLAGMTDIVTSQEFAEIYFNGFLYHSNPNQARRFEEGSKFFKETCQHAAQLLTRGGGYLIVRALRLIEKFENQRA